MLTQKGFLPPCEATKGNCPFGDSDSHYNNMEDAQEADAFLSEASKLSEEGFPQIAEVGMKATFGSFEKHSVKDISVKDENGAYYVELTAEENDNPGDYENYIFHKMTEREALKVAERLKSSSKCEGEINIS